MREEGQEPLQLDRRTVVPRGPEEWGRLLFQEEWAYRRRWRSLAFLGLSIAFASVGASVIVLAYVLWLIHEDPVLSVILVVGGGLMLVRGVDFILRIAHMLPTRVYDKGMTWCPDPRRWRYAERECFHPFDMLKSVKMDPDTLGKQEVTFIHMVFDSMDGSQRGVVEILRDDEESRRLLGALKRAMPDHSFEPSREED